jgi:hypothetical protein
MATEMHAIEPDGDAFGCTCSKSYPTAAGAKRHAREANARIVRNKAAVDAEPDTPESSPLTLVAQAPESPEAPADPGPVAHE